MLKIGSILSNNSPPLHNLEKEKKMRLASKLETQLVNKVYIVIVKHSKVACSNFVYDGVLVAGGGLVGNINA